MKINVNTHNSVDAESSCIESNKTSMDSKQNFNMQSMKTSSNTLKNVTLKDYIHNTTNKDSIHSMPHSIKNKVLNNIPTHITIQVENRKFCLSLEKLDSICRQKIINIFAQKKYSLEELLTLFVSMLRDQSVAEQELTRIVLTLES